MGSDPAASNLSNGCAFEQLHRDERLPVVLFDRVDRADSRMIEGRRRPRLAQKSLQRGNIAIRLRWQELQRDAPSKFRVLSLIHDTHASAANLAENPVVRDELTVHDGV